MLISEDYRRLNFKLHQKDVGYGSRVRTEVYADVLDLTSRVGKGTVLDYGCGKAKMSEYLECTNYDPAIIEYSARPQPHDIVACCDVLEHIEPEYLQNVLNDIRDLARHFVYLVISTAPAGKYLEDGRNAHLIVKPATWWHDKLSETFTDWEITVKRQSVNSITFIGGHNGRR